MALAPQSLRLRASEGREAEGGPGPDSRLRRRRAGALPVALAARAAAAALALTAACQARMEMANVQWGPVRGSSTGNTVTVPLAGPGTLTAIISSET